MKLARIETFTSGNVGVVRAETEDGTVGIGQFAPGTPDLQATVCHRQVAPSVLGRDIENRDAINRTIVERHRATVGIVSRALAGLDTALWDLAGRIRQQPVRELAGGTHAAVPAYASSMRRDTTPNEEADRLRDMCEEHGFQAVKLRIGKSGATGTDEDEWPGRTEELVPTVRDALGDAIDIYVDANSAFTSDRAIEISEDVLAPNDVAMFEEPCPYWDFDATAAVTRAVDVPVAAGEFLNRPSDWDRLLDRRAVDIVQPDVCFSVGFTRALDIAHRAADIGLGTRPHSPWHSMNLVFAAHLVSAVDSQTVSLEYPVDAEWAAAHWDREPGWDTACYGPTLSVQDGHVSIPDGPGWGISLDDDWIASADRRESTPA